MDTDDIVELHRLEATVDGGRTVHRVFSSDSFHEQVQTWRPVRHLKTGGASEVWAEEDATGAMRAVKTINKAWLKGRLDYRRELLAMGVLSKFPHAFVKFQGWFEYADNLCISMELVSGGDLGDYLATHGARPEAEGKMLSFQIFRALELMHLSGFTHRDLKPQNIFVVSTDPLWIKLGDFGISKRIAQDMATELRTRYCTPEYAAPEVLIVFTGSYSNKVDIWSAGCIIFEMLMGLRPRTITLYERPKNTFLDSLPARELNAGGISSDAIDLMMNLLCWRPEDRFAAKEAKEHRWTAGWNTAPMIVAEKTAEAEMNLGTTVGEDWFNAKEKFYSLADTLYAPWMGDQKINNDDEVHDSATESSGEKPMGGSETAYRVDDNARYHALNPWPIRENVTTPGKRKKSSVQVDPSDKSQLDPIHDSLRSQSSKFEGVSEDTTSTVSCPGPVSFSSSSTPMPITDPQDPVTCVTALLDNLLTPPSPSLRPTIRPPSSSKNQKIEQISSSLDPSPDLKESRSSTPPSHPAPPPPLPATVAIPESQSMEAVVDESSKPPSPSLHLWAPSSPTYTETKTQKGLNQTPEFVSEILPTFNTDLNLSSKVKVWEDTREESHSNKDVVTKDNAAVSHTRCSSLSQIRIPTPPHGPPPVRRRPVATHSTNSLPPSPSGSPVNPGVTFEASPTSVSDPQEYVTEPPINSSPNLFPTSRSDRARFSRYRLSADSLRPWINFMRRSSSPGHTRRASSATASSGDVPLDLRGPSADINTDTASTLHKASPSPETTLNENIEAGPRSSVSSPALQVFPPYGIYSWYLNGGVDLAFLNEIDPERLPPQLPKAVYVILLGDGATGKTRLGIRMSTSEYEENSPPTTGTAQYTYQTKIEKSSSRSFNNTMVIFDTGSDSARPLLYSQCDIAVICFDISSQDSLDNCRDKWIPEVQQHMPQSPFVVVGCQADRRRRLWAMGNGDHHDGFLDSSKGIVSALQSPVSSMSFIRFTDGKQFAESNGAKLYAETSALNGSGVGELSQKLAEIVLAKRWQSLEDKECRVM